MLFISVAMTEMLPGILTQLGAESLTGLRKLAANFTQQGNHRYTP